MARGNSVDIRGIFSSLSRRYDLFNNLVSFGIDKSWRREAAGCVGDGSIVLDLCSGTGDLALEIARKNKNSRIEALDFCPEMVELGARKAEKEGLSGRIRWTTGRAEELPFEGLKFDFVTSVFALRNLSGSLDAVFSETFRVLKNGGAAIALDLGRPSNPALKLFYYLYLKCVMPVIGFAVYGKVSPFIYFGNSILTFYKVDEVKAKFINAGFRECEYRPLVFGAAGIYIAKK